MLITIATYPNPTEAHIAKGLLESEGIKCYLKNELMSITLPTGVGVELQVEECDVEQALSVLNPNNDQ